MSETQKKPEGNPVGNLRVIDHKQDKACRIAAERLEELAAQARRGEVVGFHGVTLLSNGKYVVHEAAGALLDAAIARLGYAIRDDA